MLGLRASELAQRVDAYRWEALAESRALLTILSPSGLTSSMELEIGAARAWNKPIYGVVTDPSSTVRSAGVHQSRPVHGRARSGDHPRRSNSCGNF